MTFSIIIPVYNVAPYLCECVDSVLTQSFSDYEIVCVDDGSTDGSGQILDTYALRDQRIRVRHMANAGVSAARNVAIDLARGEWLYFVDADDVLLPGGLAKLHSLIEDGKHDALFTGDPVGFVQDRPKCVGGSNCIIADIPEPQTGEVLLRLKKQLWGYPFLRCLRRVVFQHVHFPIGIANMEDTLSLVDVFAVRARWLWVDCSVYGYRWRPDSACHNMTAGKVIKIIPLFTMMFEKAKESLSKDAARVLLDQYRGSMNYYLRAAFDRSSVADIRQLEAVYRVHVENVGRHTAGFDCRIQFLLVGVLGCKEVWPLISWIVKMPERTNRVIRRRINLVGQVLKRILSGSRLVGSAQK